MNIIKYCPASFPGSSESFESVSKQTHSLYSSLVPFANSPNLPAGDASMLLPVANELGLNAGAICNDFALVVKDQELRKYGKSFDANRRTASHAFLSDLKERTASLLDLDVDNANAGGIKFMYNYVSSIISNNTQFLSEGDIETSTRILSNKTNKILVKHEEYPLPLIVNPDQSNVPSLWEAPLGLNGLVLKENDNKRIIFDKLLRLISTGITNMSLNGNSTMMNRTIHDDLVKLGKELNDHREQKEQKASLFDNLKNALSTATAKLVHSLSF